MQVTNLPQLSVLLQLQLDGLCRQFGLILLRSPPPCRKLHDRKRYVCRQAMV